MKNGQHMARLRIGDVKPVAGVMLLALACTAWPSGGGVPEPAIEFTEAEIRSILQHGPWPVRW